jgi:hypothetical protein
VSHLLFNRCDESIIDNIDIIFDELKRNEIDIDKQTLSFHINTILDRHRDLYYAVFHARDLNLDQIYREIDVTKFGCIIAYLIALVCLQSDSEESVRHNVQKTIEACRIFTIPKHKPSKRPILITLSLTLTALYISL